MYGINKIRFEINGCDLPECWKQFECYNAEQNFVINVVRCEKIVHGVEYCSLKSRPVHILKMGREIMMAGEDWKEAEIFPVANPYDADQLFLKIFYAHAIQHKMIQLHGSLIDYQGKGILFLGPSGIGKTTQAELWNQYKDALIINGDIVFVQERAQSFLGWGTPWHGSSSYCVNTSVPIKALVVLKQASNNKIRRLNGFEKVTAFSNSVFYPQWVQNGMKRCLTYMDHILETLPVYELSCRPDEEAVLLTEKTIFDNLKFSFLGSGNYGIKE